MNSLFRVSLLAVATLLAFPSQALVDKVIGSGGTTTEDTSKPRTDTYKGVKHAIGVRDFENNAGWYGRWDLGKNLGIMLESALYDSGRFVVVSRENLDAVIAEQNLAASGRAAASGQAKTGGLRSAKYIATGAITTVEGATQGSGAGLNVRGFRIGLGGEKATITAIITLIDTTTGEIVAKERVTGKAGGRLLKFGYQGVDFGGDIGGFAKEPIGEAAQDVISKAVDLLVDKMKDVKLDGSVAQVVGDKVYINRGEEFGVSVGQTFVVKSQGEVITDPETGEVLDRVEGATICTLRVDAVREKTSICSVIEGEKPERGALVLMK